MNILQQKLLGQTNKEEALTLDDLVDFPEEVDLISLGDCKYKLVFRKKDEKDKQKN